MLCSNAASEDRGVFGFSKLNWDSPFLAEQVLGANPDVVLFVNKESELIGQVEVGFIVRSC